MAETRVRYVNSDHSHPLRSMEGVVVIRPMRGKAIGKGPKNELVLLDDGRLIVAPWGNWRKA